jgi:site-specific recombinase XerD
MKLRDLVTQYVELRMALGEQGRQKKQILGSFSRTLGEKIEMRSIRPKAVSAFLNGTGPLTCTWYKKYCVLHGFYRYAVARGYATSIPLPITIPNCHTTFIPYIYSREEIGCLLEAASSCQRPLHVIEPVTLRTIVLLLYGAGLRVGEALALNLADVDLAQAVLTVRQSKFFKSRLVPLGAQLADALATYFKWRLATHPLADKESPFFVKRTCGRVVGVTLQQAFKRLREHTGIHRTDGGRYQPRLHDLRHSFAVHRLIAWYRQGADVQRLLPHLSVYLGHVHLAGTQVYLTMTPELLGEASARFERYANGGVE